LKQASAIVGKNEHGQYQNWHQKPVQTHPPIRHFAPRGLGGVVHDDGSGRWLARIWYPLVAFFRHV